MLTRLTVIVLLGLSMTIGSLSGASAETTEMSADTARSVYMGAICPVHAKARAINRAVFQGKAQFRARDIRGQRARRAHSALAARGRANDVAARRLLNPPAAWPAEATGDVEKVARALARERSIIRNGRGATRRAFVRFWNNRFLPANGVFADLSETARARLGLPAYPRGC